MSLDSCYMTAVVIINGGRGLRVETHCIVACVQLFKKNVKVKVKAYTVVAYSYYVGFYIKFQL